MSKLTGYKGIYATHKYWGKKPPELCAKVISNFAEPGSTVLDPFMGSGVLARVCKEGGVNFIGSDLNPSAVSIANIFVNPPRHEDVLEVLKLISLQVERDIRDLYMSEGGQEATHFIRVDDEVKEVWVTAGRKTVLGVIDLWATDHPFKVEDFQFLDRRLFRNSRINVSQNQTVASLFTPRALKGIEFLLKAISTLSPVQKKLSKYILTSGVGQMSKMVFAIKRRSKHKRDDLRKYEVGSWVIGYWQPKLYVEVNVWRVFEGRARKLANAVRKMETNQDLFSVNGNPPQIILKKKDGFTLLSEIEDESIDLVVTDPPHSDRIPYLELSEMWNCLIGEFSEFELEWVLSNSPDRNKTKKEFNASLATFLLHASRVLKKNGHLILMFNTTDNDFWYLLKDLCCQYNLIFCGKFRVEYSANSVVQDNRAGALKHDWCLVFSKDRIQGEKGVGVDGWSESWV